MIEASLLSVVITKNTHFCMILQYLEDKWYLAWENGSDQLVGMFFTQMLYYALLLNSFIPISLYVSMNFVRFLQSWFMNQVNTRSSIPFAQTFASHIFSSWVRV